MGEVAVVLRLRRFFYFLIVTLGLLALSACGGGWGIANDSQKPTIATQPSNQTVVEGKTATFFVTATGTGTLTYQWYKNGVLIGEATSSTYTTPATTISDNHALYTVVVTNAEGSVTSTPAVLTVIPLSPDITVPNVAPAITKQPASQTVNPGRSATFSVTATGTDPLIYQWYRNDVLISGAASSTYTTPVMTKNTDGGDYNVTVSNMAGTATSNVATLTVNTPVPIATSLACSLDAPPYGSTVTLTPTFSGGTAVIGFSGVKSSEITSSAVSGTPYPTGKLTSAKTFTLTVTGVRGDTASATCIATPTRVTITPLLPDTQTIAPGTLPFEATVRGGATNDILWSATGGSFARNLWTAPNQVGTYTITATSVDDPSVSTTTTVTVSAPVITARPPTSLVICTGEAARLAVAANYADRYQWNLNGIPIPGATSASYEIPGSAAADAGSYTVTASNNAGSVSSSAERLVVGSSITSQPKSLTINETQTATFSVSAQGHSPFTYRWYETAPGATTEVLIPGATSSTYTTGPITLRSNGTQYKAMVVDGCKSTLPSGVAELKVLGREVPPTIITQPISVTIKSGETATFTVEASGTPEITYQWYRIPSDRETDPTTRSLVVETLRGAASASYTVPATATTTGNDQDVYYVIAKNQYGQAVSDNATLAINDGIQIVDQPKDVYVDEGDPATFAVRASSTTPLTYQWYRVAPGKDIKDNSIPIEGATGATYMESSTTVAETGSIFYVVVSNGRSRDVTSSTAALFVGPLSGIADLCDPKWITHGNVTASTVKEGSCSFHLTEAKQHQHGAVVWPEILSTGNLQISFTVTISDASAIPADGFAMVLGDPSLGATPQSEGSDGQGLGAKGIPGFVLGFDTYPNTNDPKVPYLAVGRGEDALWENPWYNVNSNIIPLTDPTGPKSHDYVVSITQGNMTVTMDGDQVFSGRVAVPPAAYFYMTSSTGDQVEGTVLSNLKLTASAPSN